jgi:predicted hotdog family 3-hydroxylacyl-ACP dehydratase
MNLSEIDIRTLLPQQAPFIMIDKLLRCDKIITRTALSISDANIFVENGRFSEFGIIENFAQTCAARIGYFHLILNNESVRTGFIGSIKNFVLYDRPNCNDLLITEIEIKNEVFNMTLVDAKSWANNRLIAECEMKISE